MTNNNKIIITITITMTMTMEMIMIISNIYTGEISLPQEASA